MTPLHDQVLIRLYVHVYLIVQTHISERVQRERATERETGQRKTDRQMREVRQDAEVCEKMKINLLPYLSVLCCPYGIRDRYLP